MADIDKAISTAPAAPAPSATPDWMASVDSAIGGAPRATRTYSLDPAVDQLISKYATQYGVDPDIARAQAWAESKGNQNAISPKGAIGTMQLMPATAANLGVDPKDQEQNIRGGMQLMGQLLTKYNGDYSRALAAYNAGEKAVNKYSGIPPYLETQNYVSKILGTPNMYSRQQQNVPQSITGAATPEQQRDALIAQLGQKNLSPQERQDTYDRLQSFNRQIETQAANVQQKMGSEGAAESLYDATLMMVGTWANATVKPVFEAALKAAPDMDWTQYPSWISGSPSVVHGLELVRGMGRDILRAAAGQDTMEDIAVVPEGQGTQLGVPTAPISGRAVTQGMLYGMRLAERQGFAMATDPKMWPFFYLSGPLGKAIAPALQLGVDAVFSSTMAYGTYEGIQKANEEYDPSKSLTEQSSAFYDTVGDTMTSAAFLTSGLLDMKHKVGMWKVLRDLDVQSQTSYQKKWHDLSGEEKAAVIANMSKAAGTPLEESTGLIEEALELGLDPADLQKHAEMQAQAAYDAHMNWVNGVDENMLGVAERHQMALARARGEFANHVDKIREAQRVADETIAAGPEKREAGDFGPPPTTPGAAVDRDFGAFLAVQAPTETIAERNLRWFQQDVDAAKMTLNRERLAEQQTQIEAAQRALTERNRQKEIINAELDRQMKINDLRAVPAAFELHSEYERLYDSLNERAEAAMFPNWQERLDYLQRKRESGTKGSGRAYTDDERQFLQDVDQMERMRNAPPISTFTIIRPEAQSGELAAPPAPVAQSAEPRGVDGLPQPAQGMVRLYRGETVPGTGRGLPEWVRQAEVSGGVQQASGRWFTDQPEIAKWYQQEAAADGGKARLTYIDVPEDVAKQYNVANHPDAAKFSRDPDREFFLPPEYVGKGTVIEENQVKPVVERPEPSKAETKEVNAVAAASEVSNLESREQKAVDGANTMRQQASQSPSPEEVEKNLEAAKELAAQAERLRQQRADAERRLAEAKGQQKEQPVAKPVNAILGRESAVIIPGKDKSLPVTYAVMRVADLTPSHNPQMTVGEWTKNDNAFQPRTAYGDNEAKQNTVIDRARNIEMARLHTDNPTQENGPPTVREDGLVAGGNQRTMIEILAYQIPENARKLYDDLVEAAPRFGLDVSMIPPIEEQPILVRRMKNTVTDRADMHLIGDELNLGSSDAMSKAEKSVATAKYLTDEDRAWIANEAEANDWSMRDLLRNRNDYIVDMLRKRGLITDNTREQYVDKEGKLTDDAKTLFENAAMGAVVKDSELLTRAREKVPSVVNKIERALGPLMQIGGRSDMWNFNDYMADALQLMIDVQANSAKFHELADLYRKTGRPAPVSQVDLRLYPEKYPMTTPGMDFGQGEANRIHVTPLTEALAKLLEQTPTDVKKALTDYAKAAALTDQGSQNGFTFFTPPEPWDAFNTHIAKPMGMEIKPEDWGKVDTPAAPSARPESEAVPEVPPAVKSGVHNVVEPPAHQFDPVPGLADQEGPTVVLARHGETDLNGLHGSSTERIRGWSNVPLNDEGRAEAERMAARLDGLGITHIVTSDLVRAQETGQIIGKILGVPVTTDADFRPWHLGELEGQEVPKIVDKMVYFSEHPDEQVPGGESYNSFYKRFSGALRETMQGAQEGGTPLIVAHSRNVLTVPHILSDGKEPIAQKGGPEPGAALVLRNAGDGYGIAEHLETEPPAKATPETKAAVSETPKQPVAEIAPIEQKAIDEWQAEEYRAQGGPFFEYTELPKETAKGFPAEDITGRRVWEDDTIGVVQRQWTEVKTMAGHPKSKRPYNYVEVLLPDGTTTVHAYGNAEVLPDDLAKRLEADRGAATSPQPTDGATRIGEPVTLTWKRDTGKGDFVERLNNPKKFYEPVTDSFAVYSGGFRGDYEIRDSQNRVWFRGKTQEEAEHMLDLYHEDPDLWLRREDGWAAPGPPQIRPTTEVNLNPEQLKKLQSWIDAHPDQLEFRLSADRMFVRGPDGAEFDFVARGGKYGIEGWSEPPRMVKSDEGGMRPSSTHGIGYMGSTVPTAKATKSLLQLLGEKPGPKTKEARPAKAEPTMEPPPAAPASTGKAPHEMTWREYTETPEAKNPVVPPHSPLAFRDEQYNRETVGALNGDQLRDLAYMWHVSQSGSKDALVDRILARYKFRTSLSKETAESLQEKSAVELKDIAKEAGIFTSLPKKELSESIIRWRDAERQRAKDAIAATRHLTAVRNAARSGQEVPQENLDRYGIDAQGNPQPYILNQPLSVAEKRFGPALDAARSMSREDFAKWVNDPANARAVGQVNMNGPGIMLDGGKVFYDIVQRLKDEQAQDLFATKPPTMTPPPTSADVEKLEGGAPPASSPSVNQMVDELKQRGFTEKEIPQRVDELAKFYDEHVGQAGGQAEGQNELPPPPSAAAPAASGPHTLDTVRANFRDLREGNMDAATLKSEFQRLVDSEAQIKAELAAKPVSELAPRGARGMKKSELVDAIYDDMLQRYAAPAPSGVSWSPMEEKLIDGVRRTVDTITDADIQKMAAERRTARAAAEKALTNPETYDEFQQFISRRGETALTPEQARKWDEVQAAQADTNRQREQERRAQMQPVRGLDSVTMSIKEGMHTRKNIPIFTVQLSDRVDSTVYRELVTRAKQLGGHYSTFGPKENHGFLFESREAAEKFMQLKDQGVSRLNEMQAKGEETKGNAVQKLRDVADNLESKANEVLNADRLTNTSRRANMAEGVERNARADLQMAGTLRNIADAVESGEAQHLDGVRAKTHVETLESSLRRAQQEANRALGRRYEEGKPPEFEDIDHAEYPYPYARVKSIIEALIKTPGARQLAERLQKMLKAQGEDNFLRFRTPGEINDYRSMVSKVKEIAETTSSHGLSKYEADAAADGGANYERLQKMGIGSLPELRAALREYFKYRGARIEPDAAKQAERKLVGQKIEGWFPTPKAAAKKVVEAADIKPGMSVLEPSAGNGQLADEIKAQVPDVELDAVEINSQLRNVLTAKGHLVVGEDFMQHEGGPYDRIVMNPPYENGQDMAHVQRAYGMLKPGGRLVALMGEGGFFRDDAQSREFRSWLESVNGDSEKMPEGTFMDRTNLRTTGVNTRMVTIDKPVGPKMSPPPKAEPLVTLTDAEMVPPPSPAPEPRVAIEPPGRPGGMAPMTVEKVRAALDAHGNVTPEQREAVLSLWAANAKSQGITLEQWIDRNIADIRGNGDAVQEAEQKPIDRILYQNLTPDQEKMLRDLGVEPRGMWPGYDVAVVQDPVTGSSYALSTKEMESPETAQKAIEKRRSEFQKLQKKAQKDAEQGKQPLYQGDDAGFQFSDEALLTWARNLGRRARVERVGEQGSLFGEAEPMWRITDPRSGINTLVTEKQLAKLREENPALGARAAQGGLFDAPPSGGDGEGGPPQGALFQGGADVTRAAESVMANPEIVAELRQQMAAKRFKADADILGAHEGDPIFSENPSNGAVRWQIEATLQNHARIDPQGYTPDLVKAIVAAVPQHVMEEYTAAERADMMQEAATRYSGAAQPDVLYQQGEGESKPGTPVFYSKAERVIGDKMRGPMSGDQLAGMLRNAGVKPEEMKWNGLDDFLKGKQRVTPEEAQQFLKENQFTLKEIIHKDEGNVRDNPAYRMEWEGVDRPDEKRTDEEGRSYDRYEPYFPNMSGVKTEIEMRRSVVEEGQPLFQTAHNVKIPAAFKWNEGDSLSNLKYITSDGTLVGPKQNQSHYEIAAQLGKKTADSYQGETATRFMRDAGAVRVMAGGGKEAGFQFLPHEMPSPEQLSAMRKVAGHFGGRVAWDITDAAGKRILNSGIGTVDEMEVSLRRFIQPSYSQGKKAAVQFLDDGKAIVHLFEKADVSSLVHETAHIFRRNGGLTADENATLQRWVEDATKQKMELVNGVPQWDRSHEELFARGFERYLYDGKAPSPEAAGIFEKFKGWLRDIYQRLVGSPISMKIPADVRRVYDRLLGYEYDAASAVEFPSAVETSQSPLVQGLVSQAKEAARAEGPESARVEALSKMAEQLATGKPVTDPQPIAVEPGTRLMWKSPASKATGPSAVVEVEHQTGDKQFIKAKIVEMLPAGRRDVALRERFKPENDGHGTLDLSDWRNLRLMDEAAVAKARPVAEKPVKEATAAPTQTLQPPPAPEAATTPARTPEKPVAAPGLFADFERKLTTGKADSPEQSQTRLELDRRQFRGELDQNPTGRTFNLKGTDVADKALAGTWEKLDGGMWRNRLSGDVRPSSDFWQENGAVRKAIEASREAQFAGNVAFDKTEVKDALARLRARRQAAIEPPPGTLHQEDVSPEEMADLKTVGGALWESGHREYAPWVDHMVAEVGDWVRPYLDGIYGTLRDEAQARIAAKLNTAKDARQRAALETAQQRLAPPRVDTTRSFLWTPDQGMTPPPSGKLIGFEPPPGEVQRGAKGETTVQGGEPVRGNVSASDAERGRFDAPPRRAVAGQTQLGAEPAVEPVAAEGIPGTATERPAAGPRGRAGGQSGRGGSAARPAASAEGNADFNQPPAAAGRPGIGPTGVPAEPAAPESATTLVKRALDKVAPIRLAEPTGQRGTPIYDPTQWAAHLEAVGLPTNAPSPDVQIAPDTREKLIFPGQPEIVESALSGIKQHGAFVIATSTGTGKTFTGVGVIKEMQEQFGVRRTLIVTKSQNLINAPAGWRDVADRMYGMDVQPVMSNMLGGGKALDEGIYAVTYAKLRNDPELLKQNWDLVVADESGEARREYAGSQQGDALRNLTMGAKYALFMSATPFHNGLELSYLEKLGLWRGKNFEDWGAQFGVYREPNGALAGGVAPRKLVKLREQLIERGQFINQDRNMEGYHPTFAVVPLAAQQQLELKNAQKAFDVAANYFASTRPPQSGKVRAVLASQKSFVKNYIERTRLPQAIELGKRLEALGYQVIYFTENKAERMEPYDFLQGIDDGSPQGAEAYAQIKKLMPTLPGVADALNDAFGAKFANFSGSATGARAQELSDFLAGAKKHIYATYAAGGIGVSMHDTSVGGTAPRAVIHIGLPWSGVMFDQALGRPWRFGTTSDVHAIFLTSNARPEMELLLGKIGPRLASLRAVVSGVDGTDPIVKSMQSVNGALDYLLGNSQDSRTGDFLNTLDAPIKNWKDIEIPHADEAKGKGMKYPGGGEKPVPPPLMRLAQDADEAYFNEAVPDHELTAVQKADDLRRPLLAESGFAPEMEKQDPRVRDRFEDDIRASQGLPPADHSNSPRSADEVSYVRSMPAPGEAIQQPKDLAFPDFALSLLKKDMPRAVVKMLEQPETWLRLKTAYAHSAPFVLEKFAETRGLGENLVTTEMHKNREIAEMRDDAHNDILKDIPRGSQSAEKVDEALRKAQNPERELVGKVSDVDGQSWTPQELRAAQRFRDEILEPLWDRAHDVRPSIGYLEHYSPILKRLWDLQWSHPLLKGDKVINPGNFSLPIREALGKDPFSSHLLRRRQNENLTFDIHDVADAYIPSILRVVHDTLPIHRAMGQVMDIDKRSQPLLREYAERYVRNYATVQGSYPETDKVTRKMARWVADRHYDALIGLSPHWFFLHTSKTLSNTYPELGAKYVVQGTRSMLTADGRELVARSGALMDMPLPRNKALRAAKNTVRALTNTSEFINRAVAYLGGLEKARDLGLLGQSEVNSKTPLSQDYLNEVAAKGVNVEPALDYAAGVVSRTQFSYSPAHVQFLIRDHPIMGIFKTFVIKEGEFVQQALKSGDKAKAVRTLALLALTSWYFKHTLLPTVIPPTVKWLNDTRDLATKMYNNTVTEGQVGTWLKNTGRVWVPGGGFWIPYFTKEEPTELQTMQRDQARRERAMRESMRR
jgi:broad specificity phosphatase PhoE